ncbi:MAG: CopG family transcriptional regulator [Campylobacterota bacterium]|nr:CopG family transcriptional regulator [Campylobacterota bacterium]
MAQVTINIDPTLETQIKDMADSLNLSISKYISSVLEEKVNSKWNPNIKQLSGSWSSFPTIDEIRENKAEDIKREEF